jgi:hypothetical protein
MKASKATEKMRVAGRVIAFLAVASILIALLLLAWVLSWTMTDINYTPIFVMIIITLVALAGFIISWWRILLAGILIVIVSIGLGISWGLFLEPGEYRYLVYIAVFDLPLFIAGLLFLTSWWLSKRIH